MKISRSLFIFMLIGLGNTGLNMLIMLALYRHFGLGHWSASAIGFVITSALSFLLNRKFSFNSQGKPVSDLWRFVLVIAACYFVAYALALPMIEWAVDLPVFVRLAPWGGEIALLLGNVIFTALNYLGQRFFAFAKR